ncbi:MAG: nitroreductase [Deltaproteobacteria bacterium]|nr:nitroreductase [Deltaproteobacteria bacterium]
METETAVKGRRSIRRFKPKPVPEEIVRDIVNTARWSPSWGNTQPWELYVVTGEALERFKKANRRKCLHGEAPASDIAMPEVWPETLKKRYVEVGKKVLTSLSISREDVEARNEYYGEMFALFGAPCMILVCLSKSLHMEYAMLDVGLLMQTVCLLAHDRGLGTCILAGSVRYPGLLRELLSIPEDRVVVIGTAMGYPDWAAPVNHFERERAELDEFVTWVS